MFKTDYVVTVPFRLAFPEVFAPKAAQAGGKEKFSISMLFPKNGQPLLPNLPGADLLALRKLAYEAIVGEWGKDPAKWPANLRVDLKSYLSPAGKDGWPLRDGDLVDWEGFQGTVFIRASSGFQPGLVDAKLQPILSQSDVFGGLICRAQVNAYTYDNSGNRGVTFGLSNLQVLKDDGVSFSGRQDASTVFGAVDGGYSGGNGGDPFAGAPADPFGDEPPF